ncbi:ComEC/Rec2 family competence protein [Lachnospiraceae bacterium 62-35]
MKDKAKYYLAVLLLAAAAAFGSVESGLLSRILEEAAYIIADMDDTQQEGRTSSGDSHLLRVTFIDAGQGDAALLQCDGHNMLIDAGKNDHGTELQKFLMDRGIETFDYLVGTHPDEDHIGGLDVMINKFPTEHVLMPKREADTRTYDDVIQAMKYYSIPLEHPDAGDQFYLGDAEVTVIGPVQETYSDSNNCSIVLMVRHGNCRFLFTGDAEEEAEADMLEKGIQLKADVLKAGHHGSKSSSSQEFLDAVSPKVAVISCGVDNRYGHPHEETLDKFQAMGVEVYRTDSDGTIVAESDGNHITFHVTGKNVQQ